MDINYIIIIFTAVSFIVYGINSFISKKMISEFKRWGLEKYRKSIGICQFTCGIGILLGLKFKLILILRTGIFLRQTVNWIKYHKTVTEIRVLSMSKLF